MQVSFIPPKISFKATLSDSTRSLIQQLDKVYNQNFEYKLDKTINESQLSEFCGDSAKISFLETDNPHCNIAPVITLDINGVVATHVLNLGSRICDDQDEEFLFDKMYRRPYRYLNTISNRLNSVPISQLKKSLAVDYYKKLGDDKSLSRVDDSTLDSLVFGNF